MAATINYDKAVADFIAGLDATGHVTHTKHRKLSVTFHHNGGRLSLQGILDVWKTRPASAHFQVDGQGRIGQYVRLTEYAWATGNTKGNQESISIEMANATTAPGWTVADATIEEGCRLAGWIFARAFGFAPTRDNVHHHYDWKSTTCSGPYVRSIREKMFLRVLEWYNFFTGNPDAPAPVQTPQPLGGKSVTEVARDVINGAYGTGDARKKKLLAEGYNAAAVQREVNRLLSGGGSAAPAPSLLPLDQIARQVIAGSWGSGDDRRRRLTNAGYNAAAVQAEVNRQLGAGGGGGGKSVDQIAQEVINGEWGNNPERGRRLQDAGYSPTAVQAAVNAKVGGGGGPVRLSVGAIAQQVIEGQFGNGAERERRVTAAGYNYQEVRAEVNRRLA